MINLPNLTWRASPNYSSRNGQKVRLIVCHDCEGSYSGSVSWFSMARSQVSAHIVLREDGAQATQMVAWGNKAWHAVDVNSYSEGIEAAGYSAKGLGADEWQALANIVAFRLRANGIPCQRATSSNNWTGYCQHRDLGAMGGGHLDVTQDMNVWMAFQKLVAAAYQDTMPVSWDYGSSAPAAQELPAGFKPCGTQRHDLVDGSLAWAQMRLNALGISSSPLTVDGIEGPDTRNAIVRFQAAHDLAIDGVAGPLTIAALKAV